MHSELAALRAAGIQHEMVPGVSSVLAAPLAAGFPLTHPTVGRSFAVASAHDPSSMDWPALAVRGECEGASRVLAVCSSWRRMRCKLHAGRSTVRPCYPHTFQALDTLVLLMGGSQLATIVAALVQAGRPPSTPVAVVREAALPSQQVWRGSLDSIVEQTAGESLSPCVICVGEVTGM